ncbi:bcl-2-related protein A1 isoform X1 [Prionailurus bengalensis]|uniref:bcl-2-related protein A1 isoform X1 n=1 Tax=Prionailurus bengalensis TaxID=37029 RepID=UPI001CA7DD90|nr:bcl-2-related protein A1 isoform X1 [Prionailurus bengalensis]
MGQEHPSPRPRPTATRMGPPPGASSCGKHWQETGARRTLRPGDLFLRSALLGHRDQLFHPEQGKSEAFCHTHSTVPFKRALLLRTFPHDDIRGEKKTASTLLGGTWCQNRRSFSRDISVGKILSVAGRGSDSAVSRATGIRENGFVRKFEPKSGWLTFLEVTGKICKVLSLLKNYY